MIKGKSFFILVVIGFAEAISAQSLTDVYNGCRGVNFNSNWKFNRGDVTGAQGIGFNDASWRSLNLPHDWSIELAYNQGSVSGSGGGYLDGGIGWYRKSFTLPQDISGKKVFIEFDGVYMNSQVYINGTSLGTRPYGYSTFEYDLTPYLNSGATANVLAVQVNNNQPNSRWYSGSGIYRNVWLTILNPVHVANCGVAVSTPAVSSASATVAVSTLVQNQLASAASVSVATVIVDAGGTVVASNTTAAATINAGSSSTLSQSLAVSSPHLWSLTSPYRYRVRAIVSTGVSPVDTFEAPLGIRTIRFDANTGFYLNNQSLKILGVCQHHDFGAMGAVVNRSITERQLRLLKTMGCNAIRTSHNPPAPEFLDMCDTMGMMVMEEAFDCWETGKTANDYHLYFNQWAQTDMQDMVRRDRNHPCVIMWSIGNEINNPTVATATNLRTWVRMEDTTRPVAWSCNTMTNTVSNQVANVLDLAGYNYGTSLYTAHHSTYPTRRIFGSETSAARRSRGIYVFPPTTVFGNLNPDLGSCYDNSNNSFSPISAEPDWKEHNSRAYVAGEFIWTGFDYLGENDWPTISNNDGIIDRCGFQKDIYYFFKSQWTTAPMVHILPHWNWNAGDYYLTATNGVNIDSSAISGVYSVPVWVYTNCDSVELFLNNVSHGVQRFQSGGALHLAWTVPFAAGTLKAVGRRGGTVAATDSVRTAGTPARVVLTPDKNTMKADGEGLAFITADITDANGVLCPRAGNSVSFSITGPGTIIGVDNGNSLDHSAYKSNVRQAFNGKCMAIVQSGTTSGQITVTATSGSITPGTVGITTGLSTGVFTTGSAGEKPTEIPHEWVTIATSGRFMLPKGITLPVSIAVYSISGRLLCCNVVKTRSVAMNRNLRLIKDAYIVKVNALR